MALIDKVLETSLKGEFKKLESKLKDALDSKSNGIYKAQENIDKFVVNKSTETGFDVDAYKKEIWNKVSEEWSNVISKEVIKILSDDVSQIIAKAVTEYIKTATIVVPPGQLVVTAGSAAAQTGATSAPSPAALIS